MNNIKVTINEDGASVHDGEESLMTTYANGNLVVEISGKDGTKIRRYNGEPLPEYPESIDFKITNKCDLASYCKWCHEESNKDGEHARLGMYTRYINQLPSGVEFAIGGGNPLEHPDLEVFLSQIKKRGSFANLTVNQLHLKKNWKILSELVAARLINGLGITYHPQANLNEVRMLCEMSSNVVFHVIAGVHDVESLDHIRELSGKALILGYKTHGKGLEFYDEEVNACKYKWFTHIGKYLGKLHVSFDNLAIEQLKLKRWVSDAQWSKFYMGDDGTFTMYIDAVDHKYAVSSTSDDQYSLGESISDMFAHVRRIANERV